MIKKILLLGGSAQQVVAIETAKRLGYFTILCDYLKDNPGKDHADKFYLISTTDRNAILKVAIAEKIDGILSYASDPAATTAAYVASELCLPSSPLGSVEILCNKDKFRSFLYDRGFSSPQSGGYSTDIEVLNDINRFHFPIIIKPVDSSGSKGTSVLQNLEGLEEAIEFAFSFSRLHRIIVEEFIEKNHTYLIGGDIFVEDGKIILWGLMNCHRDISVSPLVPVGKSYPLELNENDVSAIKSTLQNMVDILQITSCAMNVELIVDRNGNVWLIDVGPRNGGNMIPDLLSLIYNIDVVEMSIKAAMGEKSNIFIGEGLANYATHILHTSHNGSLISIEFSEDIKPYIIRTSLYKKSGDQVEFFDNASKALGIIFLKFHSTEAMQKMLSDINSYITIQVKEDE